MLTMMDKDYEKFLASIHSKTATPEGLIRDAVKEATKSEISYKKRIVAGEGNEVYEIGLANQSKVMVRISKYEDKHFEQEKWAIEQCKKLEIPVPEVLLIKHLSIEDKPLDICVQRRIEGEPLERGGIDLHTLPEKELKSIILQAGEILSRMHTIKTDGFGYLNGQGEGVFKTFADLMKENIHQEKEYISLAQKIDFDIDAMKSIFKILRDKVDSAPVISPLLSHNDFGPKHIVVKDGKIVGILDFGEVAGHSSVNDFAKWDYWFSYEIPLSWLQEGYSNKNLFDGDFEELLNWIKLSHGVGVLWWYDRHKYLKGVENAKKKLYEDLVFYKS